MNTELTLSTINKEEVARYLGYGQNIPDERVQELFEECEKQVLDCARARYTYKVFDFEIDDKARLVRILGTNLELTGNSICRHLRGCEKVVLMAVTISEGIDKLIRIARIRDMAEAVVIDSMSSAAVEQACDRAEQVIRSEYPDYYQTFRFGIGYGDLPIHLQADFLNVLNASKTIGLGVSKSCMLIPTKSVTAVIGLSKTPITGQAKGCQTCNMQGRCQFRKSGGHC